MGKHKFKWRKWIRFIHRDFGYLFFGVTIIYAISGIAINHLREWNPNYVVTTTELFVDTPFETSKSHLKEILSEYGEDKNYKKHYFPNKEYVKIFLKDGIASINLATGEGLIEKTKVRPILKPMNYLHYNPVKWWMWFSDIYAGALIIISITGLLILRGKTGITGRGAWLTILGIVIPVIFLLIYYY